MDSYIPLLAALASALALLAGYAYQKRKERQFEIQRTRQDIYTRLVKNLMTKLTYHLGLPDSTCHNSQN